MTFELKISSPRGFADGGIGARGTLERVWLYGDLLRGDERPLLLAGLVERETMVVPVGLAAMGGEGA